MNAILNNCESIKFASYSLKNNKNIVLSAIEKNSFLIEYASDY
jgi:hypothetical protein